MIDTTFLLKKKKKINTANFFLMSNPLINEED